MKHNSRVFLSNQPIRSQSDNLMAFTLFDRNTGDSKSFVVSSEFKLSRTLAFMLTFTWGRPDFDSIKAMASRLWSGHVVYETGLDVLITPGAMHVSELELEYHIKDLSPSDLEWLGDL